MNFKRKSAYINIEDDTMRYTKNIHSKLYSIKQDVKGLSLNEFMARIRIIEKMEEDLFITFAHLYTEDIEK